MTPKPPTPQRGAASLVVVTGLLLAMLIASVYASRGLVIEQRSSVAQYRSAQAFQAAEAGIDWTLAQLNGGRVGDACEASSHSAQARFAERTLRWADADTGRYNASVAGGVPACMQDEQGQWHCACPTNGSTRPATANSNAALAAFRVELQGASPDGKSPSYPGIVRITAHGCVAGKSATSAPLCNDDPNQADAAAKTTVLAALVPALAVAPTATLTALGDVQLQAAGGNGPSVYNPSPDRALAIDGAAEVQVAGAALGAAGSADSSAILAHDDALAAQTPDALFTAFLGMSAKAYRQRPGVAVLDCGEDCTAAAQQAWQAGMRMLWIDHDTSIGELDLGSADQPIVLVVRGQLQFKGNVRFQGLLAAEQWRWVGGLRGHAWLYGAAFVTGAVALQDTPDLAYDTPTLDTLRLRSGSFVRVPGSWKDGT